MGKKNDEAKEFLRQVQICDKRIERKIMERDRLFELATKTTSTQSAMPGGGGSKDKLGEVASRLADAEKEIAEAIDYSMKIRSNVVRVIDQIKNPQQYEVICLRYLDAKRWDDIATEMSYTTKHITRLHGWALETVAELIDCEQAETTKLSHRG